MGRIIPLHDENHWELQRLLPWFVTGQLDPAEHARVDAHVAKCEECQEELRFEQALAGNVKALPLDVDVSWRRMERRLKTQPQRQRSNLGPLASPWTGWAVAACALVAVGVAVMPRAPQAQYHVLGAARAVIPGNMVVIFRAETTERDMHAALEEAGARIVDGPTGADAYVLTVPASQRTAALTKLRARTNVVMAEPVDPGAGS